MDISQLYITILAGGVGKRMNSSLPKVLHQIGNEPMILKLLKQIMALNPDKILIVVGRFYLAIRNEIEKHVINDKIVYVIQESPLGTGDAVRSTLSFLEYPKKIINIILNGDVPMLQSETIKKIYHDYLQKQSKIMITAINLSNAFGHGRIVISDDEFKEIIEEKDCNDLQKLITMVNCGIYICHGEVLIEFIPEIQNNNSQKEYYLTDLVKIYKNSTDKKIDLFVLDNSRVTEIFNVNTMEQLEYLESII